MSLENKEFSQSSEELLNRIRVERGRYPKRLRAIADGMLAHPDEFAVYTIAEAAETLAVSPSALVRFAKTLGFSGFSPLQKVLVRGLADGSVSSYRDRVRAISERGDVPTDVGHVFEAFVSTNINALNAALDSVDMTVLSRFVSAMKKSRLVGLAGQKRAFPLASYLFYGLARLDVDALLIDGLGGMAERQTSLLGPKDTLIVISFAPYAPETMALARIARDRGVKILAITDDADGPVAGIADESLIVAESNLNDIRSVTVTSTVIQTLFVTLGLEINV